MKIVGNIILYLVVFFVGTFVFSGIHELIKRIPAKQKLDIWNRSCSACGEKYIWKETIPLVAALRYQNKCPRCGKKQTMRAVLLELAGGTFAVVSVVVYGYSFAALLFFAVTCDLMLITMIDADTQEIPPQLNVILLLLGIVAIWLFPEISLQERIIGLFAVSVPMFVLMLFNGFGGGDVKMMFAAGFLLGWKGVVAAFFIGIVVGGAFAVYLLVSKKKGRKEQFAFGPFLALGVFISLIHNLGDTAISVYIDYLKSMMTYY